MSADIQMALVPRVSLFLFVFLRRQEIPLSLPWCLCVCVVVFLMWEEQDVCCRECKVLWDEQWLLKVLLGGRVGAGIKSVFPSSCVLWCGRVPGGITTDYCRVYLHMSLNDPTLILTMKVLCTSFHIPSLFPLAHLLSFFHRKEVAISGHIF